MTIDMEPRFDGGSLRITFQASLGTTSSSDIALDDICIAPGPCGKLAAKFYVYIFVTNETFNLFANMFRSIKSMF